MVRKDIFFNDRRINSFEIRIDILFGPIISLRHSPISEVIEKILIRTIQDRKVIPFSKLTGFFIRERMNHKLFCSTG